MKPLGSVVTKLSYLDQLPLSWSLTLVDYPSLAYHTIWLSISCISYNVASFYITWPLMYLILFPHYLDPDYSLLIVTPYILALFLVICSTKDREKNETLFFFPSFNFALLQIKLGQPSQARFDGQGLIHLIYYLCQSTSHAQAMTIC